MAVGVLQPLAGQCGPPGSRADNETAGHLVGCGPKLSPVRWNPNIE